MTEIDPTAARGHAQSCNKGGVQCAKIPPMLVLVFRFVGNSSNVPSVLSIDGMDSRFNLGEFLPSPVRELESNVIHSSDNDKSESDNDAAVQEELDEFFGSDKVDS